MRNEWHVGVVIPAKNEQDFIEDVINSIPDFVDKIVVVNDGSNDETQAIVENNISTNNKIRLVNLTGKGVGFAIDTGHQEIMKLLDKPFVSVVMAGDGQMNPERIEHLSKIMNLLHFRWVRRAKLKLKTLRIPMKILTPRIVQPFEALTKYCKNTTPL